VRFSNQRADNRLAFTEGCKRQFALILPCPVAVFVCNRPRLEHLFGKALGKRQQVPSHDGTSTVAEGHQEILMTFASRRGLTLTRHISITSDHNKRR
jgi:hypothetical protein